MKYEFIDDHRSDFAVKKMCKALIMNESGYYRWKNRKKTSREKYNEALVLVIREVYEEGKKTYGAGRVKKALENRGIFVGVGRVRRLMRENGIYSITRYKHRPYPKEKVETRYTDNIVKREFLVSKPDQVW